MRLLHTSDWHLGHRFHGRQRHEEQGRFLDWLVELVEERAIDCLLVAGDVFDTTAPGSRAQALYYRLLHRLAASSCRHVVLIGGNHDSPALLEAPRELLRRLDIHVIGMADGDYGKEILQLDNPQGKPELLVAAVPYLRDRDIRHAMPGETLEDKGRHQREAIRAHYRDICRMAEERRRQLDPGLPLVVMGHLFVAGGRTVEGDGVRDLAVGGLDRIEATCFPADIDYLALGHLHLGQLVAANPCRRYCGAPLPMSFAEAKTSKQVLLLTAQNREIAVEPIEVPRFQPLASVRGDLPTLLRELDRLRIPNAPTWVELVYEGDPAIPDLRDQLLAATAGSELSVLRIRNNRVFDYVLRQTERIESLDDLGVAEVFERCLAINTIEEQQRRMLRAAFAEIVDFLDREREQTGGQP
ncbi:exonuclease SbcCD subunit D C-terminal domain-containing protein [Desulfobulbus sp.]|uniref:exonuclease SbcCD subunit D C-terminal domain-containing protein n=1 Tax=Desulfobulbus sp. TaxID=895 RepID=UPI00286EFB3E|nr:exonuclease SbcCD subunit D C-terminal domain-containing protein [Desulfobulbus sp.]